MDLKTLKQIDDFLTKVALTEKSEDVLHVFGKWLRRKIAELEKVPAKDAEKFPLILWRKHLETLAEAFENAVGLRSVIASSLLPRDMYGEAEVLRRFGFFYVRKDDGALLCAVKRVRDFLAGDWEAYDRAWPTKIHRSRISAAEAYGEDWKPPRGSIAKYDSDPFDVRRA